MILRDAAALDDLIQNHPGLTRERRQLIVDYICDMPPADQAEYLEAYGEILPNEEYIFVRLCFLAPDAENTLPNLTPSEQPLMPHNP